MEDFIPRDFMTEEDWPYNRAYHEEHRLPETCIRADKKIADVIMWLQRHARSDTQLLSASAFIQSVGIYLLSHCSHFKPIRDLDIVGRLRSVLC